MQFSDLSLLMNYFVGCDFRCQALASMSEASTMAVPGGFDNSDLVREDYGEIDEGQLEG